MKISIQLPDQLMHQIDELAIETEHTRAYQIKKALASYLQDIDATETAYQRLNDDDEPTITLADMRNKLSV